MKVRPYFLALCISCLCSTLPAYAQNSAELTMDEYKQKAHQLLDENRFQDAFYLYSSLLIVSPMDRDINLGLAWAAYGAKKYPQAVLAYERLLEIEPDNARYRLQLGYVYASMGNLEKARYYLETARKLDSTITADITKKDFDQLHALDGRWLFKGELSAGLIYDTNANQGPKSNIFSLGNLGYFTFDDIEKKASLGNYSSLALQGKRMLNQNWTLQIDADLYQRWNFSSSLSANNFLIFGGASVGMLYNGPRWQFNTQLRAGTGKQHHREYNDQTIGILGTNLSAGLKLTPTSKLITRFAYEHRDYKNPNYSSGDYYSIGEYILLSNKQRTMRLYAGIRFFEADANLRSYSYTGSETTLRLSFALPHNIELMPFVQYRHENRRAPATVFDLENRKDKQWRIGSMMSWNIKKNLSLDFLYQYTKTNSNSDLYDFDQRAVNIGATWRF